ncbi:energy transducer TonB [Cronbergia sp. UHCC 0137]|uniref:energy transducer TonB n=1 Tax=Cronbergia sp. UHCC 0137 TaxID=3110239 RepID=UPI002B204A8C|nr:energy transducer TonB [Cronbergia sp. UHCC 0137]MEA5618619.1 energy transducer TonB [Cronbergia sp. UHCC 0137]
MGFSGIAVEQRSKEVETLRTFLVYSLIGSLGLHISVLSLGIGNLFTKVPDVKDEPLEITIVDFPTEEKIPETKKVPEVVPVRRVNNVRTLPVVSQPPQPEKQAPAPVNKVAERPTTPQVPQRTQQITKATEKPQPVPISSETKANIPPQEVLTNAQSSVNVEQSSSKLKTLLGGIRDARASQGNNNSVSNQPSQTGTNSNSGNSVTVSNKPSDTGTSSPGNNEIVATAPTTRKVSTPQTNQGTRNGRAACRECNARYPESARRRGIEGRVEVAVDTDDQGNVTNVRIARSSGNSDLDEETLKQARNWKLKPAQGGRQGVSIGTEFALQGSRRHREAQQRKKQREIEARNQQTTAETPRRRRRLEALNNTTGSSVNRIEPVRRRSRSGETATTSSSSSRLIRRLRRQPVENTSTSLSPAAPTTRNRRRRREQPTSTNQNSQNKLINSLRRSRQPSPETPATPENNND